MNHSPNKPIGHEIIKKIKSIIVRSNDDSAAIEEIENLIRENEEIGSDEVLEWFNSPFVSEYDKKQVIKEIWKL